MTSRRGWRRSRRRSSGTRRSCSTTTRSSAARSEQGAWIPTTCSSRAASSTCSATRTSGRRCACSALSRIRGKVVLCHQGRAPLPPARRLRPACLRLARGLAAGRRDRRRGGPALRADRVAGGTSFRPLREDPRGRGRRKGVPDRLLEPARADLLGAGTGCEREAARARSSSPPSSRAGSISLKSTTATRRRSPPPQPGRAGARTRGADHGLAFARGSQGRGGRRGWRRGSLRAP